MGNHIKAWVTAGFLICLAVFLLGAYNPGFFTTITISTSANGTTVPATRFYRTLWAGGSGGTNLSNTVVNFFPIIGHLAPVSSSGAQLIEPSIAGTLRNLTCQLPAGVAPGVGASWTFAVRQNGAASALTCAISGASAVGCIDSADSVTVAALDTLSIQDTPASTPTATFATCSVEFDI